MQRLLMAGYTMLCPCCNSAAGISILCQAQGGIRTAMDLNLYGDDETDWKMNMNATVTTLIQICLSFCQAAMMSLFQRAGQILWRWLGTQSGVGWWPRGAFRNWPASPRMFSPWKKLYSFWVQTKGADWQSLDSPERRNTRWHSLVFTSTAFLRFHLLLLHPPANTCPELFAEWEIRV